MIHLIVGSTGAGKTNYAQKLKRENQGIIFSIDLWNNILFLSDKSESDGLDWMLERIDRAETLMMLLIKQLEEAKVDAILDLGFSKRKHREKFKNFAIKNNFDLQLHFLDIPSEIRRERVLKRNIEKGDTFEFEVTDEMFEFMETYFETPTEEELIGGVVINH
jgi:predicted kinase